MAEAAISLHLDPILVVTGPHGSQIAREVRHLPVQTVESPRWFEGRTASVQAGLAALEADHDAVLWPVDHPFVAVSTAARLLRARDADQMAVWFIPTFEGRGGHPVLWRSTIRADILDLRPDAPLRSLLPEFGPQVSRIPVDDPGVVANVDSPEEYRAAAMAWERRGQD